MSPILLPVIYHFWGGPDKVIHKGEFTTFTFPEESPQSIAFKKWQKLIVWVSDYIKHSISNGEGMKLVWCGAVLYHLSNLKGTFQI